MVDPYAVLGVSPKAEQDEIKKAHRRLVKEFHPDLNPGDPIVAQRFKDITAAYAVVGSPDLRAKFDDGEIDSDGRPRRGRPHGRRRSGAGFRPGGMFEDMFGRGVRTKGVNVTYVLSVPFVDAAKGGKRRLTLADGSSVDVAIPPATDHGQVLRLKKRGLPGMGGGPAGDALVEIAVEPHPHFTRKGIDIHLEVPVTLHEAALGATLEVPTIDGRAILKLPPGAHAGRAVRLRGKGLAAGGGRGDQYVRFRIVLPDDPDGALAAFLKGWTPKHKTSPRDGL
ncbi:MAG: DnaJ C-terminal domain-containing protein [Inquilinaceae bacterium]